MAINFSASFAACLAAGLKVPRQFMYCIAQGKKMKYIYIVENKPDASSFTRKDVRRKLIQTYCTYLPIVNCIYVY